MKIENDIITIDRQYKLENGTIINRFSHVVKGAEIGDNCMIGEHCYIAGGVKLGNGVRVQNGNNLWDGVELGDYVFIAPAVVFTNHHNPHDRHNHNNFVADKTIIGERSTLCANCTIIAPKVIGKNVVIGGGALVLVNVPDNVKVFGRVCKNSYASLIQNGTAIKGRLDVSGNFYTDSSNQQ
jgi:UDP-2-acetamido-3-amino-2,3-dideoxy-glucuronate N-acetyltransferase